MRFLGVVELSSHLREKSRHPCPWGLPLGSHVPVWSCCRVNAIYSPLQGAPICPGHNLPCLLSRSPLSELGNFETSHCSSFIFKL